MLSRVQILSALMLGRNSNKDSRVIMSSTQYCTRVDGFSDQVLQFLMKILNANFAHGWTTLKVVSNLKVEARKLDLVINSDLNRSNLTNKIDS